MIIEFHQRVIEYQWVLTSLSIELVYLTLDGVQILVTPIHLWN